MSPQAVAFRAKVACERDDTLPVGAARVTVRLAGGRLHSATVVHALGSLARPLSDATLEAKAHEMTALAGTGIDTRRFIDAVWNLDRAAGVSELLAAAAPAKA